MFRYWLSHMFRVVTVVCSLMVGLVETPMSTQAQSGSPNMKGAFSCQYYLVRYGDNLTRIAVWYGVTVRSIMDANGLVHTTIYAGKRLCIPRYSSTSISGWHAQFWNNTTQSGVPALGRTDANLDFNWGYGSPDASFVFANYFSARWSKAYTFVGGLYRFNLVADDGIRLRIDGAVVFDRYSYVGVQDNQVDIPITPGVHEVVVDYVQQAGLAHVRATFSRISASMPRPCGYSCPPVTSNGPWGAQYYSGINLNGQLLKVATYGGLRFNWGSGSPAVEVPATMWSARYTQTRSFNAGVYRFVARSDDGVRIFVDNQLVANQWVQQSARTITGDVVLTSGIHTVRVEYMQIAGVAELQVYWEFLGNPTP